ncbi:diguanylate cyclase [Bacillus sp. PAMC26568]|nr:diguanylate cyclase [Bacillus sp. PAMC26568]
MLYAMFANIAIIGFFIFIGGHLLKDKQLTIDSDFLLKATIGMLTGALGIILMIYSVRIDNGLIIDLRYIAIILATITTGPVSAIIASIIIVIGRLSMFGINYYSLNGVLNVLLIGAGSTAIWIYLKKSFIQKWVYLNVFCIGVTSIFLMYLLTDWTVAIYFIIISSIASLFTFYSYRYAYETNESYRKLKREAMKDPLTGLNNVRKFDQFFNEQIQHFKEKRINHLSLLVIDIDFFKKINDEHGHLTGDKILKEFGDVLRNELSQEGIISRNGGEEFTVLLPNIKFEDAHTIGEELRKSVENHLFLKDTVKKQITFSAGVASNNEFSCDMSMDELYSRADEKLYQAKKAGRNRVYPKVIKYRGTGKGKQAL